MEEAGYVTCTSWQLDIMERTQTVCVMVCCLYLLNTSLGAKVYHRFGGYTLLPRGRGQIRTRQSLCEILKWIFAGFSTRNSVLFFTNDTIFGKILF
jgi:hypothetical protein